MIVEIISIGDELLIGQTINTNATWMGQQLTKLGADIHHCTVIRDQKEEMLKAFSMAMERADVVLITGGLGPTKDDITKEVLCDFFSTTLTLNEEVLEHVRSFFIQRKRPMLPVNEKQAEVPEGCEVLHNANGTAPGMLFEKNGKILVSMPGVPYEMKSIMTNGVLPRLEEQFNLESLYYRTIHTQGIGESYIADRIEPIETELREQGISLAYLPSPGSVRIRLSSEKTNDRIEQIEKYVFQIVELLPQYVFGYDGDDLAEVVGKLLSNSGSTLSTVESCTGGAVSAKIVAVPGSSEYYLGSIISYANKVKEELAGVSRNSIEKFGVVSDQVVKEMASNGRVNIGTNYCVALSGIAGPDGGTDDKPVGTVWIAVAGPERVISKKFQFERNRERNIQRSVLTALNLLRCELLKIKIEKS